MIWVILLSYCLTFVFGYKSDDRLPFFHGHAFENSPTASKVNGLSIPVKRINAQKWCPESGMHFKLYGNGSEDFHVFAHHKRGNVLLKTSKVLDREERSEYLLSLCLCCQTCVSADHVVFEVASVKVDVLDTNDHEPTFRSADLKLTLNDATPLRSVVHTVNALDADSGKNAELTYFSVPKNCSFYVVPRTGEILLVDSILGLPSTVKFYVFAKDHGWPSRISKGVEVTVTPRQWCPLRPGQTGELGRLGRAGRMQRALLDSGSPVFLNVSEDASIGSVVMNLSPAKFQAASFELVYPETDITPINVGKESGHIVVARRLDRETEPFVEFTVKIQDQRGPDWYLTKVKLMVTDVNDNVPEWAMEPYPYLAVVSSEAPLGVLVYLLHARDGDEGSNGEVEYFLADGGDGCFAVDKKRGHVLTTGLPLQRDREYLLSVVAFDRLGSRSAPAMVSVIAGPRAPQFTNTSYGISIPENTPEGQPFLVVLAISFQKQPISYSLLINPSSLFSMQQETGEISLTRTLDYENDQRRYLLMVRASEGPGGLSSAIEVQVVITDENDCVPEFLQSIYSVDGVSETVTTATSLLQVLASDCDSGLNAELTYYTLSPDFSISPHGTIFPAGRLDYERHNHLYEFVVMAVDNGEEPHSGTATIRIRMANINDQTPEFSQTVYRTFVSEDAGPNTLVATVLAKDPDGDGIVYSITAGNEEGNFVIDSQKGLIRLRFTPVPKLQGLEYVLNVTATDDNASGGPHPLSATAWVIVGVDDVNNNKPIFEKCQQYREQAFVLENQPAGTFVLQVHAVDADEGANGKVKYGLMHRDSAIPAFRVHPDTGVIVTARRFDRERLREYSITVTATDWAEEPLIGICQLHVLILDQNDNSPKFENLRYEYFLREDTMIGTSFLRVAAHDDDFGTNAAVTYSISQEQPEYLRVNPVTGWVYVNQPISQRSYITREIMATDGGNRSTSVEMSVTITNVKNQPPQWEKDSYSVVIPENTARDTPIVMIKATSLLGDPRVTYNLEEGVVPETNMPVRFYLSPNREDGSASILVSEPLDYETTPSFSLRVRAQNLAAVPLAAFTTVYVNVTDVNDNVPFFTSSIYEASVMEGAKVGTMVLQVSAQDKDLAFNGQITYSLLSDSSGDHRLFRVDPELGSIYTEAVFDREAQGSYLLEVQSEDGMESARPGRNKQPNSDTAYVRVFISDVNDNKPVFAQRLYEVGVDEDADVGLAVVTVSANDEDEGANAKLRYQITSGNTGGVFDIEPEVGTIFVAQPLDYEQQKRYKLLVLASDGKWEDYAAVVVNVVNKNDEAPVFSMNEYYGSVTEELDGSPVFVLQVTATDPDKDADQDAVRYSLHGQGADSQFVINEITGEMYAQKTLDREERAVWRFVVLATDEKGEGLTGFTDVIINVWDINDNEPTFICAPDGCHGNIAENSPPGTFVMEMTAVDLDDTAVGQNAILTYRIIENARDADSEELFTIDASTGTISVVTGGLDREVAERHQLVVEARDGGDMVGTATATIIIMDLNDHTPRFKDEWCGARVSESSPPDSTVLELEAVDPDSGPHGLLGFSVVAGDQRERFYMVSHRAEQSGSLKLRKGLDYERPGEQRFNLTIQVEDSDFSSLIHCIIQVVDENDHIPVFTTTFYPLAPLVEDVAVGTSITQVMANDSDSDLNGEIVYSISPESDPYGHFIVDRDGIVTVTRPLDRETMPEYQLVVMATDRGSPALTASATVQLSLLDVNDNGPELEVAYIPVLWENSPAPQLVWLNQTSTLLHVIDRDSPENGPPFSLALPRLYAPDFHLQDHGNGTATLTALRRFDRERQREFLLPVVMTDSGRPPMTVTNTLTITVGDQNDNAHQEGEKEIYVHRRRGRMQTTSLGKVYAPDQDDWDNKTYTLDAGGMRYFTLDKSTGHLAIRQNTLAGSYYLRVGVSDGVWPDVVSGVTVHVRELEDMAIHSSASLRLTGITAREFIESRVDKRSRQDMFRGFLSEHLSIRSGTINVFSLTDIRPKTLDVRFSVHSDGYLRPEKLHGYLAAHTKKLQSLLRVNVSQVEVDECVYTDCRPGGGCSTQLSVSDTPTLVDAGNIALVSVTMMSSARCGCSARDRVHQACSSYLTNPCFNGGTCMDTLSGYRCQCPSQHEGPECQQTRRSFLGNGYAWFPPIRPCFDSHLSLEFITEAEDGLLLYSGPLATLQPGDPEDYMAIELIGGTPSLKINHGSGTLVLQLQGNMVVSDRRWHRLDVRSNSKDVHFTLDRCSSAIVMETEGVDSWAMTEDRSSCEVRGVTPNRDRYLNGSQVLQLGGVNENMSYEYPQLQQKHFNGCLRNLVVDSKLYDLGSPSASSSTAPGCSLTDGNCMNMGVPVCGARGRCNGQWDSFSCQCGPGYTGIHCEDEVPEFSFNGRSHVQYQVGWSLPARHSSFQLQVRTHAPSGVLLSLLSQEQNEYLRLEMFQGLLAVFYNLGDRPYNLTLPFHRLDNGEWHEVELDRHGKEFTLQLDGGGGRREVTAAPGRSQEIVIDQSVVMLGNSFPSGHNRSFLGCLRDLRLNGRPMPIAKQPSVGSEGLQVVTSQGVSPGCPSDACRKHQCSPPFICMDLWRKHECRCPPGHMMKENASGKVCVYTLCASRPCRHGICVVHSPSKYSCHCSEGYRGRHCEVSLALYHNDDDNTLSLSSAFAISICVLAFLVLMLGLFLYSCWRRHKGLKESVYHVSAHHGEWEDIRENVLNYDEEGGGEQDQNVFNMVELQRSLQPSPAQSLRYSYPQCINSYPQTTKPPDTKNGTKPKGSNGPRNGSTAIALRLAHPPSGSATLPSPLAMRRSHKSLSFSSQDLARYLCEVIRDTDHPLGDNPGYMTSPRLLSNRGQHGGLAVRSLSSLGAGGQGSEVRVQGSQESLERQRAQSPRLDRLKALRAVVSELRVDAAVDSAATKSTEGQKDTK
ncbi:neural-cadherin-like [Salvelinus fontinalis]|uniref:neural-cadherin-like n=1 Tax=Salvelinus fontinalis TaxID=8038 RepID=UPI0024853110|nr:neural-cadherin-like [Salvelinus fontinalis]